MSWIHEQIGVAATVDPVDANNTDTSSDVVDMSKWDEVMILILLGILNNSATNTVTVKESNASDGSAATAISGKSQAIVGTDDAKQFIISVKAEEMTKRYLIVTQDNSAHSQLMAVVVLGRAIYKPATDHDLSTVQTVVA